MTRLSALSRSAGWAVVAAAVLCIAPASVSAQPREAARPWPAPRVGFRFGYDDNANATVLGAQARITVVPGGWLQVVPSGDVTFLPGLRQYQMNADAVVVLGGRRGGLYAGGGLARLNTIFDGPDRETRTGANVVVGLTSQGSSVPFSTQLEVRWVFVDAEFDPRLFTLGVNFPLWGRSRRGS